MAEYIKKEEYLMSDHQNDSEKNSCDAIKSQIYTDLLQPAAIESGKILERIPRAINAALSFIDCWILKKELNLASTKEILAQKLSSVDPEKIVPPESYIAVPTMQSISYCISNAVLHNLYANLLAKAMFSDTKEKVHPAFVEIIKQLSPADALTLKEISFKSCIPASKLSIVLNQCGMHLTNTYAQEKFCLDYIFDIHPLSLSEEEIRISIDNLKRLGLVFLNDFVLSGDSTYDFVKHSELYSLISKELAEVTTNGQNTGYIHIYKMCLSLSPMGKLFCDICLSEMK